MKQPVSLLLLVMHVFHKPQGYRYIHEALKVVSAKSPTLIDALRHAKEKNNLFVCLDGTLIRTDRVAVKSLKNRHALMRSGKHKAFGGNVQVLTDESGYPLWVSPVHLRINPRHHRSA